MNRSSNAAWAARVVLCVLLASCGGGGGGSNSSANGSSASSTGEPPVAPGPAPTATAKDGAWSNPATWGGAVPGEGAVVQIPAGKVVTLDGATARLGGLYLDGSLRVDTSGNEKSITSQFIMVHGALEAGTASTPLVDRFTITLTGTDKTQNLMGMGTKVLGVMGGGKLELFGENRQGWTQLGAHASVGATSMTLKEAPKGWRAGDQIVIAPSGFDAEDLDVVTISSVNGTTVNFSPALKFMHWGEQETAEGKTIDMRAAVGLLTRNLKIQGDTASVDSLFGGHVMVMNGGSAKISGTEFSKMGQRGIKGRYPIHWHLANDRNGDFVENSSVNRSFQRAMVVHGTNNVRLQGNVAFDIHNHAFVWSEDGNETGNQIIGNLAVLTQSVEQKEFLFPNDQPVFGFSGQSEFRSASFWGRNFNAVIKGNIAAGSVNGIGFFFDRQSPIVVGDSEGDGLIFEDNTAHSHYRPNASGVAAEIYPEATTGHGLMVTSGMQSKNDHVFKRLTSYKNYGGAWLEDRVTRLQDSAMADNGVGVYVLRGVIDGVTIVNGTRNMLGNAEHPPSSGFGTGATGSIQVPSSHGGARAPVILDATIVNPRDAALVWDQEPGGQGAEIKKLKIVGGSKRAVFHEDPWYQYGYGHLGLDDSLGLLAGDQKPVRWVSRRSAVVDTTCTDRPDVNHFACPRNNTVSVRIKNLSGRSTDLIEPATGRVTTMSQPWYFDSMLDQSESIDLLASGARYEVQWPDANANLDLARSPEILIDDSAGQWVDLVWATSGSPTVFTQNGSSIATVGSQADFNAASRSAHFYDVVERKLYVRLVGGAGAQRFKLQAPFRPTLAAGSTFRTADSVSVVPGIKRETFNGIAYTGLRTQLPTGTAAATDNLTATTLTPQTVSLPTSTGYTSVFRGYVDIPADGIYRLSPVAIGGNVDVWLGGAWVAGSRNNQVSVVTDPDPKSEYERGRVALKRGLHPVTMTYSRSAADNGQVARAWLRWSAPGSDSYGMTPLHRATP